jgi:hypothetical protein
MVQPAATFRSTKPATAEANSSGSSMCPKCPLCSNVPGLRDLAVLIAAPDQDVHVLTLLGA